MKRTWADVEKMFQRFLDAVFERELERFNADLERVGTPGGLVNEAVAEALVRGFFERVRRRVMPVMERVYVDTLPDEEDREDAREELRRWMAEAFDSVGSLKAARRRRTKGVAH